MVEQWSEIPRVVGSIPTPSTPWLRSSEVEHLVEAQGVESSKLSGAT